MKYNIIIFFNIFLILLFNSCVSASTGYPPDRTGQIDNDLLNHLTFEETINAQPVKGFFSSEKIIPIIYTYQELVNEINELKGKINSSIIGGSILTGASFLSLAFIPIAMEKSDLAIGLSIALPCAGAGAGTGWALSCELHRDMYNSLVDIKKEVDKKYMLTK